MIRPSCFATTGNLCDTFSSPVTLEKKSEFIGQIRVTPSEKATIRKALKFYRMDRAGMAWQVITALFYHYRNGDKLALPLRFVVEPRD
jgi:hypothetical protein